jgi:HD-like signal output (HDOD) protein
MAEHAHPGRRLIRAFLFIAIVAALALIVLSLLRRTPRNSVRRPVATSDETVEQRALPAPQAGTERALSRATTLHLLHELELGTALAAHVPADHVKVLTAVAGVLPTAATDPRYAPRRPLLLPELVRAVNDSDTTRRELAQMIARDPALVGGLLKLANSPLYRRGSQPVESVERALAVLGTQGARALVAAALLQPVFRSAKGDAAPFPEMVWEHTQRAAAAAEAHAGLAEGADPFAAQLVALVMGLGAIVVYRIALDQYAARGLAPDATAIASLLDEHTANVARQIAASWELSERTLEALDEQQAERVERPASALGRSLRFGLVAGALSLLRSHGRIDDDAGLATLAVAGGSGERFERLWGRLTWPDEDAA